MLNQLFSRSPEQQIKISKKVKSQNKPQEDNNLSLEKDDDSQDLGNQDAVDDNDPPAEFKDDE